MSRYESAKPWTGRDDLHEGALAKRWHQAISSLSDESAPGIALLGFACDEGVRRNLGRVGAKEGPDAIRKALANSAVLGDAPLYDAGTIHCEGEDLEGAQHAFGRHLAALLRGGHRAIALGGGHELAYASWRGLSAALEDDPGRRIGVLNFDAHFDLRQSPTPNSGTPFLQMLSEASGKRFSLQYGVIGLSRAANTAALFRTATEHGVRWMEDLVCQSPSDVLYRWLTAWIDQVDHIHLSIDLDALPASVAPGVSAPAALGIPLPVLLGLVRATLDSGKVRVVDLAELNPSLDRDQQTARVAARLVFEIASLLMPSADF